MRRAGRSIAGDSIPWRRGQRCDGFQHRRRGDRGRAEFPCPGIAGDGTSRVRGRAGGLTPALARAATFRAEGHDPIRLLGAIIAAPYERPDQFQQRCSCVGIVDTQ